MIRSLITTILFLPLAITAYAENLTIGLVFLEHDPRFDERLAYARIPFISKNNPVYAAEMAISDMEWKSVASGLNVHLETVESRKDDIYLDVMDLIEKNVSSIILDLPGELVQYLMKKIKDDRVTLFNATSRDDSLRLSCNKNLYHIAASNRMVSDALVQYLVEMGFTKILALHGPSPQDKALIKSFQRSAARFNLQIKAIREFSNSNSPELREKNNVKLLTNTNFDYHVVFIADAMGEFARNVPYRTAKPRLVIGSAGLTASEWHWSLERYGAPQLNSRYEKKLKGANKMNWQDWSIWLATKIAILDRIHKNSPAKENDLTDLNLDGSTGRSLSFRYWSKQLRMPLILSTQNTTVEVAPLKKFIHEFNTLDSLGYDEKEFKCDG